MSKRIHYEIPEVIHGILLACKKIDPKTKCWNWMGVKNSRGYGIIGKYKHRSYVHRKSYEIFIGPIPSNMSICHRCDNPSCYRPEHLFAGTQIDNMRDASNKGRMSKKINKEDILEILRLRNHENLSHRKIAHRYNVSHSRIRQILIRA